MEGGGNNDGQGYSVAPPQQPNSWSKSLGSPPPEVQPKSSDTQIPVYFNTPSDAPSTTPSPYHQPQKSPTVLQAGLQPNTTTQSFTDPYRYQQHAPSAGPGARMTHRMPGPYAAGSVWPSVNSPATPHPPYMSPERGRYNPARPAFPGYDPSQQYSHSSQPGNPNQGPWQRPSYQPPHGGFTDPSRGPRFGHADIAGPVVPAGLQALQANNNNAALMQHQHTPMLVPNPHYNQNRVQQQGPPSQVSEKLLEHSKGDHTPQRPFIPAPDGNIYPPSSVNPPTPNYYSTQSPRPQHHGNLGPMHHPVGLGSPNISPYPTNPGTPGSIKGKARGNKSYQCPKCVKVFRRGDHLKRHLLSVHDHEHPYQCGECGKGFASVPTLLKHAKSLHIGNLAKGLMCLRCQLTFATFQEIEAHSASLHVQEDEMYMQNINTSSKQHCCTSCSKAFTSAANLKRHMQLLHKSKDDARMYCRECGKGFTRIDMMRKHVEKVHNGNPSALPDELDDAETLSQEHSSESESRGPSADTDESSMSAPPANTTWGSYPVPIAQHVDSRPASLGHPPPVPPPALAPFPHQYQNQISNGQQPPNPETGTMAESSQQVIPSQNTAAIPHVAPIVTSQNDNNLSAVVAQPQMAVVQSNDPLLQRELSSDPAVLTPSSNPAPLDKIEAKSVSEALSMAMKALSDSDYETPGFEMYPYPDELTMTHPPPLPYHRIHTHQQQLLVAHARNGMPANVNGHRPRGASPGMLPFMNNHNNYEFSSRQSGNFLMTMPPPPGSMSMGRLPPQPVMAGAQEAPQVSRLLQGGGGGVKSPMVINNNNNCNAMAIQPSLVAVREITQNRTTSQSPDINDDCEAASADFPHTQPEEKPDLSCNVCKTEYESIDALMLHIESDHLKQNPHECCICQKHFAQAGNVKRHIRFVHLRERPFRCKDCSCTFDRLCYLQRHMRTHLQLNEENQEFNPLKPCCCPECGKRCLTAHHLRGHMQRKHFAKNKQNYEEFLAKYGHLEALGTGPGAISQLPKSRRGRKRKGAEKELITNGLIQHSRSFSDPMHNSSALPDSSYQPSALSKYPIYQCPPPAKIPPAIHLPPTTHSAPQQLAVGSQSHRMPNHLHNIQRQSTNALPNFHELPECVRGQPENQESLSYPAQNCFPNATNADVLTAISLSSSSAAYNEPNLFEGFDFSSHIAENRSTSKVLIRSRTKLVGAKEYKKLLTYRCKRCVLRSFLTLEMLKSHMAVAHKSRPKSHVCLKCGDSFNKSCYLRSHVKEIHKKKQKRAKTRHFTSMPKIDLPQSAPLGLYQSQQLAPGYAQNIAFYPPPSQDFHGYDPNSPAMVPSPNVQMPYLTPSHFATQMPLIQT